MSTVPAGKVSYADLDGETQDDVVHSIERITKESQDDIRIGLENSSVTLPLVKVDPSWAWESIPPKDRLTSPVVVRKYKESWLRGDSFPPIIIASDDPISLHEGFHRTKSAIEAGIKKILAIDLAGIYVKKTSDGLETYGFRRRR